MDLGLTGAAALVTGGSRGIGLAVANALVAEGARVAVLSRSGADVPGMVSVQADTTDDPAVRAAVVSAAASLGGLDVVVNAAAPRALPTQTPGLAGLDDADFLTQLDTKALGYARVVRAAAPYLLDGGGRVVNISGMNARMTGSITGSTRNIAVVAITKNLADELGPQGVTVTCVHPGLTDTEQKAADVAAVITFLCSPLATLANGAVITLDGGHPGPIWA